MPPWLNGFEYKMEFNVEQLLTKILHNHIFHRYNFIQTHHTMIPKFIYLYKITSVKLYTDENLQNVQNIYSFKIE